MSTRSRFEEIGVALTRNRYEKRGNRANAEIVKKMVSKYFDSEGSSLREKYGPAACEETAQATGEVYEKMEQDGHEGAGSTPFRPWVISYAKKYIESEFKPKRGGLSVEAVVRRAVATEFSSDDSFTRGTVGMISGWILRGLTGNTFLVEGISDVKFTYNSKDSMKFTAKVKVSLAPNFDEFVSKSYRWVLKGKNYRGRLE